MSLLTKLFGNYSEKEIKRIMPLQQRVLALEEEYRALSDEELKASATNKETRIGFITISQLGILIAVVL